MGVTPEQIVVLARDCDAVRVPTGERVLLQEGRQVRITQAMGGSYTVLVDGNLARIDGEDADALGFETVPAPALGDGATDEDVDARLEEMAAGRDMSPAELRKIAHEQGWDEAIRSELVDQKALDWLVENADVEEIAADAEV